MCWSIVYHWCSAPAHVYLNKYTSLVFLKGLSAKPYAAESPEDLVKRQVPRPSWFPVQNLDGWKWLSGTHLGWFSCIKYWGHGVTHMSTIPQISVFKIHTFALSFCICYSINLLMAKCVNTLQSKMYLSFAKCLSPNVSTKWKMQLSSEILFWGILQVFQVQKITSAKVLMLEKSFREKHSRGECVRGKVVNEFGQ